MSDLGKLSQLLIEECSRLEPSQTEVCADEVSETKVVFENTDFSVASSNHSTVFGLRTIVNGRLGFITTNSLDERELKRKAAEAQMVARLSPANPNNQLAPKQDVSGSFEMYDQKLADMEPKIILKMADLLVKESLSDSRARLDRIEISVVNSTRVIQNSNGVSQKVRQATCSWFVMGMAKSDDEVTSFDYEGDTTSSFDDIEKRILKTTLDFRESVLGSIGARIAKSYNGPVILHPAAVGSLISNVISFNVNGRAQQDGMSKWAQSIDKKVASPLLNFSQNPLDETRATDWTPFDREGVLTQNREIVKNGVLKFTAHNVFSAKRGGVSPTGNAVGSARSVPSIGLHGLKADKGEFPQNKLYEELKTGLVLKRFSGNADPVSGQFSGVAKNSWWIENGQRAYPLKEVMISGNMFDLIQKIHAVGAESFRQMGSFDSPYIIVDGLNVTSG